LDTISFTAEPGQTLALVGPSGSGKSTLANALEKELHAQGKRTYILDGDNIRQGLNKDLGFTDADRVENIRRVAEVAKLMMDAGLIVMTAFISPFRAEREMARELIGPEHFIEVFMDTPLDICLLRRIKRDIEDRGRSLHSVIEQYETTVRPSYFEFIEPSRQYADLVVTRGGQNQIAIDMIKASIRQLTAR
jgi:adenylyl-sulfate kinase